MTCGHPIQDRARFCTNCGSATSSVDAPASEPGKPAAESRPRLDVGLTLRTFVTNLRTQFVGFIRAHEVAWELSMAGLAVAFVIFGFGSERLGPPFGAWLGTLAAAITVLFVLEVVSRLAATDDPQTHLKHHLIDLVALVPMVRLVRVLDLLAFLPRVPAVAGFWAAAVRYGHAARSAQAWLVATWVGVAGLCVIFLFGYADASALDGGRRLVASLLVILGIGAFSGLTSALTSSVMRRRDETAAEPSPSSRPASKEKSVFPT
jgi:hypothetical protein